MAVAPVPPTQLGSGNSCWCRPVRLLLAALTVALVGCASLPAGVQGSPSQALAPVDSSQLVAIARRASPGAALTGVRLLPLGTHSLDARLQLIARATQSLDLQYYVLDNDNSGRLLLGRLADAAVRDRKSTRLNSSHRH